MQGSRDVPTLLRDLQSPYTTHWAAEQLLKVGKSDPEARKYLATHLPPIIEKGPRDGQAWTNAVQLAANLKLVEASAALAKWVGLDVGGTITFTEELRLENDPAAKALAHMGNSSLPVLVGVLKQGNLKQRWAAAYVLNSIGCPAAKRALREHLKCEREPGLRAFIEWAARSK